MQSHGRDYSKRIGSLGSWQCTCTIRKGTIVTASRTCRWIAWTQQRSQMATLRCPIPTPGSFGSIRVLGDVANLEVKAKYDTTHKQQLAANSSNGRTTWGSRVRVSDAQSQHAHNTNATTGTFR
jgi:hypothetical protein